MCSNTRILSVLFFFDKNIVLKGTHRFACQKYGNVFPCLQIWERDIDSLVKTPPHGLIQSIRSICGRKNQNICLIVVYTLHSYKNILSVLDNLCQFFNQYVCQLLFSFLFFFFINIQFFFFNNYQYVGCFFKKNNSI